MITLDSALKILKKYGYSSKTVHPFLYKNNKEIGINYSYIDSKYGITERVISFHNDADLDMFLKKYQWYKLNGKKEGVSLKLNNYEVANPEVLYIRKNHVMTDNEMFNIKSYDKLEDKNNKLSHTKRLLIEAENLMDHYYLEKKAKEKYTNNLLDKERELKRYYLDLQNLIDRYNKNNTHPEIDDDKRIFNTLLNIESEVNMLISEYNKNLPKEEHLYKLIDIIWDLNKSLETNNSYMYALRYNDDVDEEMRLTVTKIDFMKELLSKKTHKIVDLKKKFKAIDSQSTYESIYDDNFESKYKDFINKKYDVRDKINEFRLAEYLNNFKTNKEYDIERNINRCKNDISVKLESFDNNIDDIKVDLKKQFNNNLNDDEKNALILYVSFYRELFDMIQSIDNFEKLSSVELLNILNITDSFTKLLDDCFNKVKELIKLDVNKDSKNTIFKNINFDSKEKFIESIKNNIMIIANINNKMKLKYNFKLYFSTNDINSLDKNMFIFTSSIIAPYMQQKSGTYRVITADCKKNINVLYSPKYVVIPTNDTYNKRIEVLDYDNLDIFLDTRDININKDSNTIIYTRFKSNLVKTNKYTYVDKFSVNYKININKVIIEKRNNNE
ncbi:MAG: hypothetical protein IJ572_05795 [Bacilli bacterium]|nr:hypothetical protein [Bacilli bacterium]